MATSVLVGVERPFIRDIKDELSEKANLGADYYVAPLFHPRLRRDTEVSGKRLGASTRSDRELESRSWITNIVGKISDWIDLDSIDEMIRKNSLQALQQETSWAAHLSLQAILIPSPRLYSTNYARAMLQAFTGYQQIYVRIPLIPQLSMHYQYQHSQSKTDANTEECSEYCKDGWLVWDGFRQNLGDFTRFFVALELTSECEDIDLDSAEGNAFVRRWCAEPVKLIILPVSLFLTNNAGFPVLSRTMQRLLSLLLPHCAQIVLTGKSTRDDHSYTLYAQYLRYLKNKDIQTLTEAEKHVLGYEDTLQAPLQPLMDNLEAQTYETFERDPTKYIQYEKAITRALLMLYEKRLMENSLIYGTGSPHRKSAKGANVSTSEQESPQDGGSEESVIVTTTLVLTVVGAGRGPLVAAALSASSLTNIPIRVYAIEKNANAVITLRNRAITEFWSNVTIVSTDMRDWVPPELCDILVSELLGSFGDNELSPECLDGAQKCLKHDGVSIPHNYTSFIAPIATSKLWNTAKAFNSSNSTISNGLDTAYVVRFKSAYQFATAQSLFVFEHPNRDKTIDNTRYGSRSFISETDMVMHGIAGFFESVLYSKELLDQRDLKSSGENSSSLDGQSACDYDDFTPTSPRSPRTPVRGSESMKKMFFGGADGSSGKDSALKPRAPPVPPPPGGLTSSNNKVSTPENSAGSTASDAIVGNIGDVYESGNTKGSTPMVVDVPLKSSTGPIADTNKLYAEEDTVMLSIVPQTHTEGMQSWFPLFIPLAQPVRVKKGDTITIHIWRCADARKVWYEWCLSSPVRTPVQNSGGKAYSVGL